MIYGLYGRRRSGKDTTYSLMCEVASEMGLPRPERRSFAYLLKKSIAALFDITVDDVEMLKEWSEQQGNTPPLECAAIVIPQISTPSRIGDGKVDLQIEQHRFTMRQLLERYGTEAHRDVFGDDFWVESTLPDRDYTDEIVVCTDMRFPNEYDRVRRLGGSPIRIFGTTEIESEEITHVSQAALDQHDFDWSIDNSERDMDDLKGQVRDMMEHFHG